MRCPRCRSLGALIGLHSVLCPNTRCPCYHEPSRRELDALPSWERYSGDTVDQIRRMLWRLENPQEAPR